MRLPMSVFRWSGSKAVIVTAIATEVVQSAWIIFLVLKSLGRRISRYKKLVNK